MQAECWLRPPGASRGAPSQPWPSRGTGRRARGTVAGQQMGGLSPFQGSGPEWEEPAEPTLPPGEQGDQRVCPRLNQPCQHPLPTPPLPSSRQSGPSWLHLEVPRLKATLIQPQREESEPRSHFHDTGPKGTSTCPLSSSEVP